jgi:RNA polymerase sigma-70 factor (family 1)
MNDDLQLFRRIAEGDELAFEKVFHRYTPRLLPFIKKITRNDSIAAELIQETFIRIWMQRAQLEEIENPSAWIYRIASNLSINYLQKLSNRKQLLTKIAAVEKAASPEELVEVKELNQIIKQAISQLPERRQEVYLLSREEGLSHQQIAERLNISVNTVKNQIVSSLKFIQQSINKQKGLHVGILFIFLIVEIFF